MAHKKGVGSTDNGRDSKSKRLGVKLFGSQTAKAGNILVRQRGTKYHPGENVYMGRDHTLHASVDGTVVFRRAKNDRRYVSIVPFTTEQLVDVVTEVEVLDVPADIAPAIEFTDSEAPVADVPVSDPNEEAAGVETPVEIVTEAEVENAVDAITEPEIAEPFIETPAEEVIAPQMTEAVADQPTEENPAADIADIISVVPDDMPVSVPDDLKLIEGIGPKIAEIFNNDGIHTFAQLAETPVERLREILDAAGPRYQMHDPGTWPAQARFAAEGKWEELKEYQEMLIGGRNNAE